MIPAAQSRYIAEHIPGARYVELPGTDISPVYEGADEALALIEEFVTGQRRGHAADRALVTVLFSDIVDSTRLATKLGEELVSSFLTSYKPDQPLVYVQVQAGRDGGPPQRCTREPAQGRIPQASPRTASRLCVVTPARGPQHGRILNDWGQAIGVVRDRRTAARKEGR